MKPRIVYFGTPQLAVPPLEALIALNAYEILAVITQPDKPSGRGQVLSQSPVKQLAVSKQIRVLQPTSLKHLTFDEHFSGTEKNEELVQFLNSITSLDLIIVVAYGKIIPDALIRFPKRGILNIHMSLLPRWRGAAPIQRAILHGDRESGVTLMQIDAGLDTGAVYSSDIVQIEPEDDTGALTDKLVAVGTQSLLKSLPDILSGTLIALPQPERGASYAEKLEKSDFRIAWERSAAEISQQVRAASPHPGATAIWKNETVKIFRVRKVSDNAFPLSPPGTILEVTRDALILAVGEGEYLALLELQFAGKKRLSIHEILKGKRFERGERFC